MQKLHCRTIMQKIAMNVTNKIQCLGLEGNENVGSIYTCMM